MSAVLQAKDLGLLAGLTENAVKQWTIGRPYAIRPSIRLSSGKGMPNLYSLTDALRFSVAIELTADGFQSRVIQQMLNSFDATATTLLIRRNRIEFSSMSMLRCAKQEEAETREFVQRSFYLLDLKSLRSTLYEHWEEMLKKGLLYGANRRTWADESKARQRDREHGKKSERRKQGGQKLAEGQHRKPKAGR